MLIVCDAQRFNSRIWWVTFSHAQRFNSWLNGPQQLILCRFQWCTEAIHEGCKTIRGLKEAHIWTYRCNYFIKLIEQIQKKNISSKEIIWLQNIYSFFFFLFFLFLSIHFGILTSDRLRENKWKEASKPSYVSQPNSWLMEGRECIPFLPKGWQYNLNKK